MNTVNEMLARWRSEGTAMNTGASPAQLHQLEALIEAPLPEELTLFYSQANGMPDDSPDSHMVCFWSIDKIRKRSESERSNYIGFADFSIDAWHFSFRKTNAGVSVFSSNAAPGAEVKEIGSFMEFLTLYLTDPERLEIF